MTVTPSRILRPVFRLSADSFPQLAAERFGAQQDMDRTWHTFEPVARTLVDSFYLAIDHSRPAELAARLDAVDPELRGIAYEGAGMGLMLLDSLLPTRDRLQEFLAGPGARYRCLVYIGAGLVLPRVPRSTSRFVARQDPLMRWFVLDGYGFYLGFFAWKETVNGLAVPRQLNGYARRAFDQGLGRSFWFSTGANVDRIIGTISRFPAARRADLWSGIGVACAYAAGVMDRSAIERLLAAAGDHQADIAVGAAIASVFRAESGHPAPHTDLACEVIWRRDSGEVAELAEQTRPGHLVPPGTEPYEQWRARLRDAWPAYAAVPVNQGEMS
jgi:enediyne biosynthesis protein E3